MVVSVDRLKRCIERPDGLRAVPDEAEVVEREDALQDDRDDEVESHDAVSEEEEQGRYVHKRPQRQYRRPARFADYAEYESDE
jgi:hypothetical protein